jgi:hypothetical protein
MAYLPFTAKPVPNTNGRSGLFVVSSKSIWSTPIFVTQVATQPIALVGRYTVSAAGTLTDATSSTLVYSTVGASGGDHVYAVDLDSESTLMARQIGSLTLSGAYCSIWPAYSNLADPTTLFLIIKLPNNTCDTPKFLRVNLTDSASTAPIVLPTLTLGTTLLPLYTPAGLLAGMAATDSSNNLVFYTSSDFASSSVLLTNVSHFQAVQRPAPVSPYYGVSSSPEFAFLVVTRGVQSLYQLNYAGALSADLYDCRNFGLSSLAWDDSNLYFAEQFYDSPQENILQVASDGQRPAQLDFTYPGSGPVIVGVAGSRLLLTYHSGTNPMTGYPEDAIDALPVPGVGAPVTIASYSQPAYIHYSSAGNLFVTLVNIAASPPQGPSYSTQVIDLSGNVVSPTLASSSFVNSGYPGLQLKVTTITDTTGLGGGTISMFNASAPQTLTPLVGSNGTSFALPAGSVYLNLTLEPISKSFSCDI